MCTCPNQLQPHDGIPGVCPSSPLEEARRLLEAQGEDDPRVQHEHPYSDELHLGGEG